MCKPPNTPALVGRGRGVNLVIFSPHLCQSLQHSIKKLEYVIFKPQYNEPLCNEVLVVTNGFTPNLDITKPLQSKQMLAVP